MMKKIKFLIIPLLCTIFAVNTLATTSNNYTYDVDNEVVEVSFKDNSSLTEEQKQNIVNVLVYGEEGDSSLQPRGVWCTLFGHDLTTESVTVVHHKMKDTSPRCYKELYSVDSCSNCDYVYEELVSGVYIVCCAED